MNEYIISTKDGIKAAIIFVVQKLFFMLAKDFTPVAGQGPFLVIAPHPDDETLGCGAFIARARNAGQRVRIVTVTDGAAADVFLSVTYKDLVRIRRDEAEHASAVLGVGKEDLVFLNLPDRNSAAHMDAIENALREQIELVRPKFIISPYGVDRHPDHRTVASVVDKLCKMKIITCPVLEYPLWFWPYGALSHLFTTKRLSRLRRIDAQSFLKTKRAAMQAHHTQCPKSLGGISEDMFSPHSFKTQFFNRYELFFEKFTI